MKLLKKKVPALFLILLVVLSLLSYAKRKIEQRGGIE